jgi:hypothetical protein
MAVFTPAADFTEPLRLVLARIEIRKGTRAA